MAELGLPVDTTSIFRVTLGHGKTVQGQGRCNSVILDLGDIQFTKKIFLFDPGSSDMILGMQWLETLVTVVTNWRLQVMNFFRHGKTVVLKGDSSLERSKTTLKAMLKSLRKAGHGVLIELHAMSHDTGIISSPSIPPFLADVLNKYTFVFQDPAGLPPLCCHEHHIAIRRCQPYQCFYALIGTHKCSKMRLNIWWRIC